MFSLSNYVSNWLASLARLSAHKPIHVIFLTTLLTAVAYLSVVDEYLNFDSFDISNVSFYHPPSSKDYKDWTFIEDASAYPNAARIAITPLEFRRIAKHEIPAIANTFYGVDSTEKYLISEYENAQDSIDPIRTVVSNDGTAWKIVHQYKISKYQEYLKNAYKTLQSVIRGAETYDIAIITIAYAAMYYTFFKLFYDMRTQANSKFWLGFASTSSSLFAFLLAVGTAKIFNIRVSLLSLSEGIPFLVATVGFNRIVKLSAAVLNAAAVDKESHSISLLIYRQLKDKALNFVKDQLLCAAAFVGCSIYASHLEGLRSFCLLSAFIMIYDVLLTYSYYSAVLALKVEINMIHQSISLKDALEEDGIPELAARQASLASFGSQKELSLGPNSGYVTAFKIASVAFFFAFHAYLVGSNWVFLSSNEDIIEGHNLSKSIAKHISIGSTGTVVTLLEPKIYVPKNILFQVEDLVISILEKLSTAIRDKFISKTLLFFLGTSSAINVYLLNAARAHSIDKPSQRLSKAIASKEASRRAKAAYESQKSVSKSTDDTASSEPTFDVKNILPNSGIEHTFEELVDILKNGEVSSLSNEEVTTLVVKDKLPLYALEKKLGDTTRAVAVRRQAISKLAKSPIVDSSSVPYLNYDYDKVFGACCENVIGYIPLPLGVAGPLLIDGKPFHIPMATTEGCLVASTMRGCKAINAGGGVSTVLTRDGMTRGPCVKFPSLQRAGACKIWLDSEEGQNLLKKSFNSTSRFARLQHVQTAIAGSLLFIRFRTTTGDAMGMNMISKGVEFTLKQMVEEYGWSDMDVISVSGNYCTDKKAASINWTNGRGKSIVAEARIPGEVVRKVLKSDVDALVELNVSKNLIGSAMAGSIGGFNAHAANLVTAVFLACGQDPAQNVESSNCITLIDNVDGDLQISVSMPSIEVGTIGGGTILEPQGAMLDLLGVRGPHPTTPGANAHQLAKVVASAVLAAELSLCSALAAGHLVQSHMQHNRGKPAAPAAAPSSKADVQRLTDGSKICIKS